MSYPIILSAENVGDIEEDSLVRCVLTNGKTKWYGDFTQKSYRIEVLKREFAARGVPENDIDELITLAIRYREEQDWLAE